MKIWQAILLVMLLVTMPILSACELLGLGSSQREQEYYRQQLEAYKKIQEANQQRQEAYNQQVQQALEEYSKAYKAWQEQQLQKQLEQVEGMPTDNQS